MRTSPGSSSAFSPPFEFPVPRSRALIALILAVHALAAAPALILELPVLVRPLWLALVVYSAARCVRSQPVKALRLTPEQTWELVLAQEGTVQAELVSWFSQTWLCVLRFRAANGRHSIVLPAYALPPALHRRLRVLLGMQRRRSNSA
jgi:hypothetical protein